MISMSLSQAAPAIDATLIGEDLNFTGCSTDTRTIENGNLFIALKGENFDGHDYVQVAEQKGASSLMLESDVALSTPLLKVSDTRKAMGLLAQQWRDEVNIPVVAITGSNGKTTVKEMVASILSGLADVHATKGNFNNDIGVPLTLFDLSKQHKYAVIEMGANHAGEIEWLSAIARPNVAVITQCAPAHLEGFGSIEGVARAKSEIYSGLQSNGTAIINADDDYADFWRDCCEGKKQQSFGIESADADIRAANINENTANSSIEFELRTQQGSIEISLPLSGKHNVMNALAAAACCLCLDVSLESIKSGLERMSAVKGRLQIKNGHQGVRFIDDTYNANPTSLAAALNVLKQYEGKRYLVLGDMGELGNTSEAMHREAGELAKQAGIEGLLALGSLSANAIEAFGEGAMHFDSHEALNTKLETLLGKDVTVLVKGSRTMQMERIVNAFTGEQA